MRQARDGDRPGEAVAAKDGLERLKSKAWGEHRGMSRMEAMEEYVKLVTEIAPQWKVAHLVRGGMDDAKAPVKLRRMVWVVKVSFERVDRSNKEASLKLREAEGNGSLKVKKKVTIVAKKRSYLRATSFVVLQAESASQARAFYEDEIVKRKSEVTEVCLTGAELLMHRPLSFVTHAHFHVSTGRPP